ncbi:hypothetical protein JIN85_03600 [Luteolibacter pohnpeiensis]|uniref:Uncharacterized protein n=1 Tax=Luteolibacter pohnpeiensis TaxID=454153 RepID=A0A934S1G4_9BACT|nr:hypothetical protein [Luteolibacter pohnpeiensis]MBK1881485.1 hypothetical protein [Luteolibacter pohnpeiensis]
MSGLASPDAGKTFGIIGLNRVGIPGPSEVAIQLLGLLDEDPALVGGAMVKILPVGDPVAFEHEVEDSEELDTAASRHVVNGFSGLACDGLLEIHSSPGSKIWIEGEATPRLLRAITELRSKYRIDQTGGVSGAPSHVYLRRVAAGHRWSLQLHLPECDFDAGAAQAVARFIAGIFKSHAALGTPVC